MWTSAVNNIDKTGPKTRRLVWLLSLLLLLLPYSDLLQASVSPPAQMPCHHQTAANLQHGDACRHELDNAGCHCCQWHAPASIVTEHGVSLSMTFLVAIEAPHALPGFPATPQIPLYRPPKTAS
jgi:hypothetical protein